MEIPEIEVIEKEDSFGWKFEYKGKWYGMPIHGKSGLTKEKVKEIGERERSKIIEVIEKKELYG